MIFNDNYDYYIVFRFVGTDLNNLDLGDSSLRGNPQYFVYMYPDGRIEFVGQGNSRYSYNDVVQRKDNGQA